jgi:hypothetical protein
VSDGKRVAVVRVDPVAEPPCVTSDGQLFERVSGETITVRGGADVRALYDRGRVAAERAEANALRALDEVATNSVPGVGGSMLLTVLSIAPVGTARDIAAEVFSPRAVKRVRELVDALPREPHFPEQGLQMERSADAAGRQDAVVFETTPDLIQMWRLAHRLGRVSRRPPESFTWNRGRQAVHPQRGPLRRDHQSVSVGR